MPIPHSPPALMKMYRRGIGEAHRVAGGGPQICINLKMVGQMLEKPGVAAFAKPVADVCDTLAARDVSPHSRSPKTNR